MSRQVEVALPFNGRYDTQTLEAMLEDEVVQARLKRGLLVGEMYHLIPNNSDITRYIRIDPTNAVVRIDDLGVSKNKLYADITFFDSNLELEIYNYNRKPSVLNRYCLFPRLLICTNPAGEHPNVRLVTVDVRICSLQEWRYI